MQLLVQNRPRRSGVPGSDHHKKWTLNRPWSAAGGSRDTEANALACLSRVAGSNTGAETYNIFYNMHHKALAKPSE